MKAVKPPHSVALQVSPLPDAATWKGDLKLCSPTPRSPPCCELEAGSQAAAGRCQLSAYILAGWQGREQLLAQKG